MTVHVKIIIKSYLVYHKIPLTVVSKKNDFLIL